MNSFAVKTLGCKVNQYESQQIRELLQDLGLSMAGPTENADIVVVNTCCVTHIASAKSRQIIRKIQRQNPDSTIVVAGCLPAVNTSELKNLEGNICLVHCKSDLPACLKKLVNSNPDSPQCWNNIAALTDNRAENRLKIKHKNYPKQTAESSINDTIETFQGQSRAFLKVQDGCDGHCSYCIIPRIRTRVCNKDVKTVIAEAKSLVNAGHREIVLTGIFLGAYGQPTVWRKKWDSGKINLFANLVYKVAQVPGLERLRLSSLEPGDVTDHLLDVMSDSDNIMPHLHLPLQSGSDTILRRMCRQYNTAEYRRTIARVKTRLDTPAITTDIIVGFPGETHEDFDRTMQLAEDTGFSKIHVFSFSPREGTPAQKMKPHIKPAIIKRRSVLLRQQDEKLQAGFRRKLIGKPTSVLIESRKPLQGRCERYFMVKASQIRNPQIVDDWLLTGNLAE